MLGNYSCFCCRLRTYKSTFFKNSFRNTIRVSDSVALGQDCGPGSKTFAKVIRKQQKFNSACWVIFHAYEVVCWLFSNFNFSKNCFWNTIRVSNFFLLVMIWVQAVCKSYQQTTKHFACWVIFTVKPVLCGHSKIDKTKTLMTNSSLMKVESIAECSLWPVLSDNQSWKPIFGLHFEWPLKTSFTV